MRKFFSSIFLIISILFIGCNLIIQNYKVQDFSFTLPRSAIPNGDYKVNCKISGAKNDNQTKTYTNYNDEPISFTFENIPLNQTIYINIEIYKLIENADGITEDLKYKGSANTQLTVETENIINITLKKVSNTSGQEQGDYKTITNTTTFSVGDIIFSDNKVLPYEKSKDYDTTKWSTVEKAKAIAIIFRASSGTNKALGIGVKQSESAMAWALNDYTNKAKGASTKIDDLICTPSNNSNGQAISWDSNVTFSGTTSGKDSWSILCSSCDDAESNPNLYPAFNFVQTYGTSSLGLATNNNFAKNWYLPSIAEIVEVYSNSTTLNSLLNNLGNEEIKEEFFWTCSQSGTSSGDSLAWLFNFMNKNYQTYGKNDENYVCAIREF